MPDQSPIADFDTDQSTADNQSADNQSDETVSSSANAGQGDASASSTTDSLVGATSGEFYDAVAQVVKIIRPAVQADQGDIFLRGVDEDTGVVSVELVGACITCPASSQTLKQGLERILSQRVEGVTSVVHVGEALAGYEDGTAVSL